MTCFQKQIGLSKLSFIFSSFLLACSGPVQQNSDQTSEIISESLPIPEYESEESPSEEQSAGEQPSTDEMEDAPDSASETESPVGETEPDCDLDIRSAAAQAQTDVFRRWLRDQSVGRQVTVEDFQPQCGDREDFYIAALILQGPAGGLQSLGRALESYYPGSSWNVGDYDRLEGQDFPLRIEVEVRIPTGDEPRPRCTWDTSMTCP